MDTNRPPISAPISELRKPSRFWRPLQRIRIRLGLVPDVEVEALAEMLLQIQVKGRIYELNFQNILKFIEASNRNFEAVFQANNQLVDRVKALEEKIAKYEGSGEGDYVQ